MKTIAIACVLLATTVQAADVPAAWLRTYTSRVQAIDVDTREPVSVQIRNRLVTTISFPLATQIAEGVIRVDFRHNVSNAQFMDSNPPSVTCWAQAPHYGLETIRLDGTNDLDGRTWRPKSRRSCTGASNSTICQGGDWTIRHQRAARILLTDDYLPKFKEAYWYAKPWEIESYYSAGDKPQR